MGPNSELATGGKYTSRRAIVLEAVIAIADCDDSDEVAWHRAWCRFWQAVRQAGWAPRPDAEVHAQASTEEVRAHASPGSDLAKTRWSKTTPDERKACARRAAWARWGKVDEGDPCTVNGDDGNRRTPKAPSSDEARAQYRKPF